MAEISPVELLELFQRAQAAFTDRVDAVEPDQWEDEALPEWTVADLVAHMVTEMLWVAPLLAGEPYAEGRFPDATTDLLGDDPFEGWESAADGALSAFAEDDALLRTVHLERGPTPAGEYIQELIADLTVHAWDLARATGGGRGLRGRRGPRPGPRGGTAPARGRGPRGPGGGGKSPRGRAPRGFSPRRWTRRWRPPRRRACWHVSAAARPERPCARPLATPPTSTRRSS